MSDTDLTTVVTVPMTCSRAQKEYQLKLPLEEVPAHVTTSKKKSQIATEVSKTILAMPVAPDLIVFYKGKGVVYANVHESQDTAVERLVNLIAKKDIFDLPEPTKRKSKGGEEPEVAVSIDEEG